jgi:hypothetical protein
MNDVKDNYEHVLNFTLYLSRLFSVSLSLDLECSSSFLFRPVI